MAYVQAHAPGDEHVLIVPGAENRMTHSERALVYSVASPLVSRTTRYRALLNLRAVEEVIEREQPDIIESADPYQLGWAVAAIARRYSIPAVAYYHSDFARAYLRPLVERFGRSATTHAMNIARRYTASLYNRFAATFVPSQELQTKLTDAGVRRVHVAQLGVDTHVFAPMPNDAASTRLAHNIPKDRTLLLYVGRLAKEKNVATLFGAFALLVAEQRRNFHLLIVGDGQQRGDVERLASETNAVTWIPHCASVTELAALYRAADLFVHPGVQETFGLVALEGQACGTPVVGIRGNAMDGIILHDQESWALENSAAALAEAIERSTTRDLPAMGTTAAQRVAERFDWRRVFDRQFCFYRQICADYRRSPAA